jgi:nucleoside-diphosphate-sugar epimerase/uncharacterized membrane protein
MRTDSTAMMTEHSTAEQKDRRGIIAITGVSGFIGRALLKRLVDRYTVVGLDHSLPKAAHPTFEAIRVDLTVEESVKAALERIRTAYGSQIASVIHLAGYYDLSGDPSPMYEDVTVRGTERLLRALGAFEVEQFIYASTMLVHEPTAPGRPIDEESALRPSTPYPQSKADTERLIHKQRRDIPAVVLRLAGVYNDRCSAAFLSQQIANIYERQFISYVYPGDPGTGQAYLHIDDLVDAVARVVHRRATLPEDLTLLLAEPETFSYSDLQKQIGLLLHGEEWETRQIPQSLAKTGQWLQEKVLDEDPFVQPWMIDQASDHYEVDITRAAETLDWHPRHRLWQTLPKMTAALKDDPPGWYKANKLNAAKVAATEPVLEDAEARTEQLSRQDRKRVEEELGARHSQTAWAHLLNVALGLWLVASPFALGLFDAIDSSVAPPAAGHPLAAPEIRNLQLAISEIISGACIVALSLLALRRGRSWPQWANAAVGVWLLFAPLIFWTTSSAAYANDTLVGMLVIVLAVMVPPQPGISLAALASSANVPFGWTYSPSSYAQRMPIVALALVGLLISRYLAAYQLGHIDRVWEPFFAGAGGERNGTEAVITSTISRSFPIADAGFGAIAYALDVLTGAIGDRRRWRTMPWLVLIFGLLIIPLGLVSVGFIIIQPTIIGAVCTLCLIQTAITIVLIPYSIDEIIATVQYLAQSRRMGRSLWKTLIAGGPALNDGTDPDVSMTDISATLREFVQGGVTFPWTLVASVAIGLMLLAAPLISGASGPLYSSAHVAACLVITIAVTAMAEVARAVRFINVPIGLWIAASPLFLDGGSQMWILFNLLAGLLLVALSLPRGARSREHYGSWDRMIV